jgi:predicted nucleic acid-binding protein
MANGPGRAPEMNSMSDKCFVDTNIFLYAHDPSAGAKHRRALELIEKLWESGRGVLSTQVLQELCLNLRRKVSPPLPVEEVRQLLRDYSAWEVVVNDAQSVIEAMEVETRHKLSFWDALIVHAAASSGAEVLYSEDLGAGRKYGAVRVVNPLLAR